MENTVLTNVNMREKKRNEFKFRVEEKKVQPLIRKAFLEMILVSFFSLVVVKIACWGGVHPPYVSYGVVFVYLPIYFGWCLYKFTQTYKKIDEENQLNQKGVAYEDNKFWPHKK